MPLTIDGVEYIAARELMKALNVSRATLWRWRNEGKIPSGHRLRGRQVVFTRGEADAVRGYAHRVEPIASEAAEQLPLFERRGRR
jgi:predicted DNA-binding transcriptional regulator AlpA